MEQNALKDLDPRLQKQIENARKAVDKNPAYAIDIISNIVARHPGCLDARKVLRQAQHRANSAKSKGLGWFFSKLSSLPFTMGSTAKLKKDPAAVMIAAEKLLNTDPSNVSAHKIIGAAAEAMDLFDTATFAYAEIFNIEPKNVENIKALMSAYIKLGDSEAAIRIGDAAYREHPADDEIQSLIKKASVEQSIHRGKWDEDQSFRDKLKDEDEAHKLEQASRAKTGEAGLLAMIKDAKNAVAEEPENINLYREISSNYRKLGDFDNALEWISQARQLEAGRADINLERLEGTLKHEKMMQVISAKEAALEADPESATLKSELEVLRDDERMFRLTQAEDIVHRYPNEYSYRYELGELYHTAGKIDKAIKELQLAQRSPKVRIHALILLGKAYKEKGFFDLAAEQLNIAKSEIPGVTDQKKDVLYELGSCYEQQNDLKKAMVEFKALYGADISYRDVAQKIDDFYSQK